MEIICPICAGSGVIVELPKHVVTAQMTQADLLKASTKKLCPSCKGTGAIQSGFLARQLGLLK